MDEKFMVIDDLEPMLDRIEEKYYDIRKKAIAELSKIPDREYILEKVKNMTSGKDVFVFLREEFLIMERQSDAFAFEDSCLMQKLSKMLTKNPFFWRKPLGEIDSFFERYENCEILESDLVPVVPYRRKHPVLKRIYREAKKLSKEHILCLFEVPEYKRALFNIDKDLSESSVFLVIRNEALKRAEKNLKGRFPLRVVNSLSKDIFDDYDFWQKPDKEVFAKINEMKERGELD